MLEFSFSPTTQGYMHFYHKLKRIQTSSKPVRSNACPNTDAAATSFGVWPMPTRLTFFVARPCGRSN